MSLSMIYNVVGKQISNGYYNNMTRQYLQARGAQTPTYNYYPTYVR